MPDLKPWKTDVAVLLIFFARPEQFAQCFESVRQARPSKLLLWQDGPRENHPDDMENIEKCRKIAENIDWDCEVYRKYNEKNYGCDPSTFYSHKWAFSIVDKCIILEDDLVPSQSFFGFCKELLDRYENDERIDRICGLNSLGHYEKCGSDYLFLDSGYSTGWATWRRVADTWEENYNFLDDEYAMRQINLANNNKEHMAFLNNCIKHKNEGVPYWEYIISFSTLLNSRLVIIPAKNMIRNVGINSENSTHAPTSIDELSKKAKTYFYAKTYELEFPLKHPKYIVLDKEFKKEYKQALNSGKFSVLAMKVSRVIHKLFKGDLRDVKESLDRKIRR